MSRPGTSHSGGGSRPGTASLKELEHELRNESTVVLQKIVRLFVAKCRVHKLVAKRFEKIWDPRRQLYYYYDTVRNASSWKRPSVLGQHDLKEVAPTYTRDEAATMLQRQCLRRWALRRVRMLYQAAVVATFDEGSGAYYYYNPASQYTAWELPSFMGSPGRIDWDYDALPKAVRWGPDGRLGDDDGADDDSDASVESAVMRQRRRDKRKFPRSKLQSELDSVEDNFSVLRSLNLCGAGAQHLSSRLYDLTNLTTLRLANNRLERLSSSLQYLVKLQVLDVSHNALLTMPREMQELVVLRELHASHNRLSTYSGYLYKMAALQVLDLSHNLFRDLPVETGNLELFKATRQWDVGVQCLKALQVFRASHNLFERYPSQLDNCPRLREISLAFNSLQGLPATILQHSALTLLDLSFNRLHALPPELYKLPLQRLLLRGNCLASLPTLDADAIPHTRMTELVELDLSHNLITHLDARLSAFGSCKRLCASDNQIEVVDDAIGALGLATHLHLARNKIAEMPAGLAGCKNLQVLELQNNLLTTMPLGLSTMKALTTLDMSHNDLQDAPAVIFGMTSALRTVLLAHNRVPKLPQSWFTMSRLAHMDLSSNRLEGPLPRALGQLKELEVLLLRDNLVTELPETASQLTRLRVLELDHNKIATALPAGLSRLQRLWRCTASHNLLPEAPSGLFHLPLLSAWDLSWNRSIVSQYVDWHERERAFSPEGDFIPLPMLQRLLRRAWASLEEQPRPAAPEPDKEPTREAGEKEAREKEAGAAAAESKGESEAGEGKKGKKRASKREAREAKAAKRQTLRQLLAWHASLKDHFRQHLTLRAPGAAASDSRPGPPPALGPDPQAAAMLAGLAASTHLAAEQRRVRLQLVQLVRASRITRRDAERRLPVFAPDAPPDVAVVEGLDLGARFQASIELFSSAAREVSALATLAHAQQRQQDAAAGRQARRDRDRGRAGLGGQDDGGARRGPPEEEEGDDDEGAAAAAGDALPTARSAPSMPPLSARSNTSHGRALLSLALGEAEEKEGVEPERAEEPDPSALPKAAFFRLSAPPALHHFPQLSAAQPLLQALALDAYLGLGSALLRRVDCFTLAVRELERRGGILVSALGVESRIGADLEDLAADSFAEVTERLRLQEERRGQSVLGRKQGRMAALMAQSGLSEAAVDIDEDDEESAKAKRDAAREEKKRAGIQQAEAERLQRRADGEKKAKLEAEAAAEEARAQALTGDDAPHDEADEKSDPHARALPWTTAMSTRAFLLEHRRLTLLWACKALDAAAELLKMRGWDPERFDAKQGDATRGSRALFSVSASASASAATPQRACVERGWEHLGAQAIALHLARGRALQLSGRPRLALDEYRCVSAVGHHKFFREMAVEAIKTRLADSDYAAARRALVEFISDEVPDADRRFPEVSELLKADRRLACLLMLADAGVAMMRSAGVAGPEQTLRFAVLDDGLLARPAPIRETLELANRRNPRDAEVMDGRAAASADDAARQHKEAEQAALVSSVDAVLDKYTAQLQQSRDEMAAIAEAVRQGEVEAQRRAAEEKELLAKHKAVSAARLQGASDKWASTGSRGAQSKGAQAKASSDKGKGKGSSASAKGAAAASSKKDGGKGVASGKGARGASRSPSPGRKK